MVEFAWSVVDWAQFGTLIGAGFLGGFADILMTLGIQFCPLMRQAGLDFPALAFAIGLDAALLAVFPGTWTLTAMMLVISAAFLSFRTRQ